MDREALPLPSRSMRAASIQPPIDISIFEMDKPSSLVRAELARVATFKDLEEGVVSHWKKSHHECVELYVAGFFTIAGGVGEDQASLWAAIQPTNLCLSDSAITSNDRVIALLAIARPAHPNFHFCRPTPPSTTKQLFQFCGASVIDHTLPSPTDSDKRFFIRTVYSTFYKKLNVSIQTTKAIIVTGTPGIGKTMFLWYLFRKFRRASKVVVFDCEGYFLLAHPNGVILRGERRISFEHYLGDHETIYLCDASRGSKPLWGGGIAAKTIVTTSPDPSLIDRFAKKLNPKILCMPLWSLEELQACRCACYRDGTALETVATLFELFGGTARETIVPNEQADSNKRKFYRALNTLSAKDISTSLDLIGLSDVLDTKENSICHRFVHLYPTDTRYDQFMLLPASELALRGMTDRHTAGIDKALSRFLAGSAHIPEYGSTRGILFERCVHNLVAGGGEFRIRKLYAPDPRTRKARVGVEKILKMTPTKRVMFTNIEDIKCDEYAVPKAKNFPAFDAIRNRRQLFQMTVSKDHKLSHQAVNDIWAKLNYSPNIKIYFAVPDDIFDEFKYQPYVTQNDTIFKNPIVTINQFALCIDLSALSISTNI